MTERPGFVALPHAMLDAAPDVLSAGALLVALRLLGDCAREATSVLVRGQPVRLDVGEALTGSRNLARRTGLHRSAVRRAFDSLERIGWFHFKPALPPTLPPGPPKAERTDPPPTIARCLVYRAILWPPRPEAGPPPAKPAGPPPRSKAEQKATRFNQNQNLRKSNGTVLGVKSLPRRWWENEKLLMPEEGRAFLAEREALCRHLDRTTPFEMTTWEGQEVPEVRALLDSYRAKAAARLSTRSKVNGT